MLNDFFFSTADTEARSLRFDRTADARLTRTPSSTGSSTNFTFSCWIKLGQLGVARSILSGYQNINNSSLLFLGAGDVLQFQSKVSGTTITDIESRGVLRDPSAWYHILLNATSSGSTAKLYVNNVLEDSGTAAGTFFNTTDDHAIGVTASTLNFPFDGLMAEVYMIDGTTEDPTDFGEYDSNGLWVPKAYSGGASYGTNGFYLDFATNSSTSALGTDKSGNSNNWTVTNFSVTTGSGDDSFIDTPTNNFATLNPLDGHPTGVDNGNLDATSANAYPTIIPGSGSWYYEVNGTGYTWNGTRAGWTQRSGSHNFGQRAFSGTATADTLCTANLTAPTITDPLTAMEARLYTGNGTTQTIGSFNFGPDLVWIKCRSNATGNRVVDVLRGAGAEIATDVTAAEATANNGVTAFGAAGFNLGSDSDYNNSGRTYAAWCWDAGTSTVSNTDGSTTASVRANASAGFSIVTYTGTGSNATVGHGLNAAPYVVLIKNLSRSNSWQMYHNATGANVRIRPDRDDALQTAGSYFNNTAPTSSVFSLGGASAGNRNGSDLVAYCWAPVDGYSSFGSYVGTGDSDGPFVNLNFRPAWLMIKRTDSSGDWFIFDSQREGYNADNDRLLANETSAEGTADFLDILSNGFILRSTNAGVNASSGDYLYMAFAESPFLYSNAR